jgi:hypothetical protein
MAVARQGTTRRRASEYWLVAAVAAALVASGVLMLGLLRVPF